MNRITPKNMNNLSQTATKALELIPGDGLKGIYAPVNVLGTLLYGENLITDFLTYWVNSKNQMSLSVREQEIIILRMGYHYKCDYVWKHHIPVATEFGVTENELTELKINEFDSTKFSKTEAALISLCDQMMRERNVSDELWLSTKDILQTNQVVDLIHLIGQYVIFALTNNVFKVEVEPSLKDFSSVN